MEKAQFEEAGINYDQAINRFMNKQEMYEKFLVRFTNDKSYGELKAAIEANDCDAAFRAAHTLKGVTANLAMDSLTKAASDTTEKLRAGNIEEAKELMQQVDVEYNRVMEFIQKL